MEKMVGAGSSREFFRVGKTASGCPLPDGRKTAVLMRWDGKDGDWDYFLALNEIVELHPIIPAIIEEKRSESKCLVRDCGRKTLKMLFAEDENEKAREKLFCEVAEKLLFWQSAQVPKDNLISSRIFTMSDLLWESDYFREHVSPLFCETRPLFFSEDFEHARNEIAKKTDELPKILMHRDFQSENIVFEGERASFVDVQGARIGPFLYDAASLLFDPYLYPKISENLRESFLQKIGVSDRISLYLCALQRLMQAMGAYGNLSSNKNKPHYRKFIAPAAIQAKKICEKLGEYKVLREIFSILQTETKKQEAAE